MCYLLSCLAIIIGFTNTSYTVDEGIGTLQVDVQVFSPPDDQLLTASVDLVIQTVSGSASKCTEPVYLTSIDVVYSLAGGSDYAELREEFADVFLMFSDTNRQQSFGVTISDDSLFEVDVENFTLELRFDPLVTTPSNVTLNPYVATVDIIDDDSKA